MPITPTILAGIREQLEYVAKRGHAQRTIDAVRRATVVVCGQVMRVRGGQGKRVAEVWAKDGRHAYGNPSRIGAVGMAASAHVCRNLKTARLKRPPTQKWHPPVPQEATAITVTITKTGKERRRVREMGTGAYDPRRYAGTVGTQRVANTNTVVGSVVRPTRVIILGGRKVEVAV